LKLIQVNLVLLVVLFKSKKFIDCRKKNLKKIFAPSLLGMPDIITRRLANQGGRIHRNVPRSQSFRSTIECAPKLEYCILGLMIDTGQYTTFLGTDGRLFYYGLIHLLARVTQTSQE
jgi:hypothetical protein